MIRHHEPPVDQHEPSVRDALVELAVYVAIAAGIGALLALGRRVTQRSG